MSPVTPTYFISGFGVTLVDTSSASPSQLFVSEGGVKNVCGRVLGGGRLINQCGTLLTGTMAYIKDARWDEMLVNESYHYSNNSLLSIFITIIIYII